VLPQLRVLRAECGAIAHQCGLVYCFLDFGRAHPIVAAAPQPIHRRTEGNHFAPKLGHM
jgi:hypothetical protein